MPLEEVVKNCRSHFLTALLSLVATSLQPQLYIPIGSLSTSRVSFPSSVTEAKTEISGNSPVLVRKELQQSELEKILDFSIALKMRDFSGLKKRITNRETISLQEIAAKYYPTSDTYDKTAAWLKAQGFSVKAPSKYNLSVFASGPVALVEKVFATKFGRVSFFGEEHTSAIVSPSLPADVAGPVLAINGLQPHLHARHHFSRPLGPLKLAGSSGYAGYSVGRILTAYNASALNANGAGQTIAIVIDTFPSPSDLTTFWQTNFVPQSLNNIQETQVVPGSLPAPSGEETLDVEWSSATAPGATIHVYATKDLAWSALDQGYQAVIDDLESNPAISQLSLSFSLGETYIDPDQMLTDDMYFTVLTANGVSIFAASGDGGATPGMSGNPLDNSGAIQVEFPASDPNVTSVGGTSLNLNPDGTVISEIAWYLSGGGVSQFWPRPTWQNAPGAPAVANRMVPDVALDADTSTGVNAVFEGEFTIYGGTSVGAPVWAGISALINQSRISLGLPKLYNFSQNLYPLVGSSSFRQITSGNNGYYSAGPGYNLCTGLGTPNVGSLITSLALAIPRRPASSTPAVSNFLSFSGDFNHDGNQDILWRNTATGDVLIWFMSGSQVLGASRVGSAGLDWKIVATADFDGSGYSDILWENINDGRFAIWVMRGSTVINQYQHASPGYQYEDLYNTGQANIIWRSVTNGEVFVWSSSGAPLTFNSSAAVGVASLEWNLVGTADLFGDGQQELIWRNRNSGQVVAWKLAGNLITSQAAIGSASLDWRIVGFGNLNGSSSQGILWRNIQDGALAAWSMQGFSLPDNGSLRLRIPCGK